MSIGAKMKDATLVVTKNLRKKVTLQSGGGNGAQLGGIFQVIDLPFSSLFSLACWHSSQSGNGVP